MRIATFLYLILISWAVILLVAFYVMHSNRSQSIPFPQPTATSTDLKLSYEKILVDPGSQTGPSASVSLSNWTVGRIRYRHDTSKVICRQDNRHNCSAYYFFLFVNELS